MRKDLLPYYLQNVVIRGFEDPKKDDDKDDKSKESGEDEEEEDDDDEGEDKDKPSTDGLKSALRKERIDRKKAEKELKQLRLDKEANDNRDASELDKAKSDATKNQTKAEKLAVKLKDAAVDNAITKLSTKLKFRDLDDALRLVDRDEIDVDQDEDEPDKVKIEMSTVEEALKTLAKNKPHLILADGQEDRSGSKFNGKPKSNKEADEDALRETYPALGRSAPK